MLFSLEGTQSRVAALASVCPRRVAAAADQLESLNVRIGDVRRRLHRRGAATNFSPICRHHPTFSPFSLNT